MRTAVRSLFFYIAGALAICLSAVAQEENPKVAEADSIAIADVVAGDSLKNIEILDEMPGDSISGKIRVPRKVTPVDIDDKKPTTVLHYYDKHGNPLAEPVMFLATLDTVVKPKSKPLYPLYNGVTVGANFGEAVLMACGQSYGSFGLHADVSLHNWFFPYLEVGVGIADSHPKNSNFTYRTKPSFYTKLGLNYNFLYKSNPAYQFYLGVHAGFSSFKYDVEDVTISSDYWGENQKFNLNDIKASVFYGEAAAGLKVKIYKNFSLGWSIFYHFKFKVNSSSLSRPWFIPGYGAGSPIGITISAFYTLPGAKGPDDVKNPED